MIVAVKFFVFAVCAFAVDPFTNNSMFRTMIFYWIVIYSLNHLFYCFFHKFYPFRGRAATMHHRPLTLSSIRLVNSGRMLILLHSSNQRKCAHIRYLPSGIECQYHIPCCMTRRCVFFFHWSYFFLAGSRPANNGSCERVVALLGIILRDSLRNSRKCRCRSYLGLRIGDILFCSYFFTTFLF